MHINLIWHDYFQSVLLIQNNMILCLWTAQVNVNKKNSVKIFEDTKNIYILEVAKYPPDSKPLPPPPFHLHGLKYMNASPYHMHGSSLFWNLNDISNLELLPLNFLATMYIVNSWCWIPPSLPHPKTNKFLWFVISTYIYNW